MTWSLSGADAGDFRIDQSGNLTFDSIPDYESPDDAGGNNEYQLTVVATDDGPPSQDGRFDVTVTVSPVNEGPEISRNSNAPGSPPENTATDLVLARYTATDPEDTNAIITRWSVTGTDGGDFLINEQGELRFRNVPDYERPADSDRNNEYLVTVRASDGRYYGTFDETVTVTNENEPPEISSSSRTEFTYRENGTSALYTYRATDPERGAITWSVAGRDALAFEISEGGALTFESPPDFESPPRIDDNEYQVTVQASDGTYTASLPVTVTVTDVNEGPEVTSGGTAFTVQENQDWLGATFSALDPEGGTISRWRLSGRDGGDFTITGTGLMTFRNIPDYERPADSTRNNMYEVTVQPYDGRYYGFYAVTVMVTPVNEPPTITTKSRIEFTQRENTASILYTYRATDQDRDDAIRWSVEGIDGDDFAIHNGILTFRLLPDYENPANANGDNEYRIVVVAADRMGLRDTVDATIAITEVNEGPVVSGRNSFTVAEDQDLTGASFLASDQEGDAVTRWSLSGRDGGDFLINENGDLTFRYTPDYDRPADSNRDNEYLVTIRAYDAGNRYGHLVVTVKVTNVNEHPPVVTGSNRRTASEGTTSSLYTYRATDQDLGDSITWSVSGTDGRLFDISNHGALTFRNPPDHENPGDSGIDNQYDIEVEARDGGGLAGSLAVAVIVTAVNEQPRVSGTSTFTINENQDLTGASYTATDPEGSTGIRWSLSGYDRSDFVISEDGVLTFRNPPDFERPADSDRNNEYLLTVRAHDGRTYGTLPVMVEVLEVNEPPVITGRSSFSYRENGTGSLYTFRATDPEGDAFTWSLGGPDGGDFAISERGVLTFVSPPDFESPAGINGNEYQVTVQARDDKGSIGTFDVTITVTDLNERPAVSGQDTISVPENHGPAQTLATYSSTDHEGSGISRWSLSGSDGGDFLVNENGQLTFRYTPDYDRPADSNRDNEYRLTVRAYKGRNYDTLNVTVAVENVNEYAPVVTGSSSLTFRENVTSSLYTYRATDLDRNTTITWSVRGTDGDDFEISERGVLAFEEPPNHEIPADLSDDNVYLLTVVATDEGGREGTLDVTVTVTEVNEGPEITERSGGTAFPYTENEIGDVATFTAIDPEDPTTVPVWSLSGTDGRDFAISQTGVLTFRYTPDYDRPADSNRDNEYRVTICASDGRYYGYLEVTVTVANVNEHAPVVTGRNSLSFRENVTSALYTYRATDGDRDTETAWTVRGTDGGDFDISDTGALTFKEAPDYEIPADLDTDNEYEITIVARDEGGMEGTLNVTVTITEQYEGPDTSAEPDGTEFSINENEDRIIATFEADDPEGTGADLIRWSVSGTDGGDFTINQDGELTFRFSPDYERPADSNRDNLYLVTVRASDGRTYGTLDIAVKVLNVNEPPIITGRDAFSYRENGTSGLYTYRATDPERTAITWSVSGTDVNAFQISETGTLALGTPPDFDEPTDAGGDNIYMVTVTATDTDLNAGTFNVTVTVTDVNEGPEITGRPTISVEENRDPAQVLATYSATDPEQTSVEITGWSLSGTDRGDFTISERGQLAFRVTPDHERPADSGRDNEYRVTVRASDGRYYGYFDVTITVNNVNEPPDITGANSVSYRENGTATVATYRATDPERSRVT